MDEEIIALGEVTRLPDDADKQLEAAKQEESNSQSQIGILTEQLNRAKADRAGLDCDETLLLRSDDIQQLHKQRIEIRKEKDDLPKRRAELASAEARLRRLADELGWDAKDVDDLIARIPRRDKVSTVRTLLTHRGEHVSTTEGAEAALEEAEAQVQDLKRELDRTEGGVDVSTLAAVIRATRDLGDIESRIKAAEKEIKDAQAAIQKCLKPLRPQVANEQALLEIVVPARAIVQDHRDAVRELERRTTSCRDHIRTAEREIARHRKAYERLARDEEAVAPEDLTRAREKRDGGWSLIRRRYIEGETVPEDELTAFTASAADLPEAYEDSVKAADDLVDRRFDKAEAAAQITLTARQIAEQQELLDSLREEERRSLCEDNQTLQEAWQKIWTEAPFEPLAPDSMLEWLDARDSVLDTIERSREANNQIGALQKEVSDARAAVIAELVALGRGSQGPERPIPPRCSRSRVSSSAAP